MDWGGGGEGLWIRVGVDKGCDIPVAVTACSLFNSKKIEYFRRKNLSKPVSYRLIFNVFKQNNLSYSLQKQVTSFPSFTE